MSYAEDKQLAKEPFCHKGYSRIYVKCAADIEAVKQIMREVDSYEVEGYLPEDLISVYEGDVKLIYSGKFEMSITDLMKACWDKGIHIWCLSQRHQPFSI